MMKQVLDNIVWHTLAGPHAKHSIGNDAARRYAPGLPPIAAFRDLMRPDLHALAQFVLPGERLYCSGWNGDAPDGWRIESESVLLRMTWEGSMPAYTSMPETVSLDSRHAHAAVELAALTRPGPFTPRTFELGEYFGIFDGARLVAMAGGRGCAGGYGEISGVCTHPDYTGRGLARRLVIKVLERQLQRGESPFLRVMQDSIAACHLYRRLGFRDAGDSVARTIVRCC